MNLPVRNVLIILSLLIFFFPGQVHSGETVLFGINVPLTGAYAVQGEDELRAYMMAIEKINDRGGILGKKIIYSVMDTRTNDLQARENTKKFIKEGAVMITGGSSSAVAIAQSDECQKGGVIFMAALTHSNEVTGKDGHRHTFRWYNNAHQSAKALAHSLIQKFGQHARYAFIYADYIWGRSVLKSLKEIVAENGGKTIFEIPTPLGTQSFIAPLFKAKLAKPDVLVLILFGRDMVISLRQATKLELRKKMAIVVPLMDIHMARSLGPESIQGVITSMPWYHGISDMYPGTKHFVNLFLKKYKQMPGNGAAVAWVDIFQYADAVERAKSFDPNKVIKALENHHFKLLMGDEYWRAWDHQGIHPTFVLEGKKPLDVEDKWDLFKIIGSYRGDDIARTRVENPVQLEKLP